ncbi:MAG: hypothetical protein ACP5I3_10295 [Thermoproteus sp.]
MSTADGSNCPHRRVVLTPEGLYVCLDCGTVLDSTVMTERYKEAPRYSIATVKQDMERFLMRRWHIYLLYKQKDVKPCALKAAQMARTKDEFEELYRKCVADRNLVASRLAAELGIDIQTALKVVDESNMRLGRMVKILSELLPYRNANSLAEIARRVLKKREITT